MNYTMRVSAPSIDDKDIEDFEKSLKILLPDCYKEFLKKNNGGRPTPKYFPISGFKNNPVGQIQDFFSINDPIKSCRIDWEYLENKKKLPGNLFPIAIEDGGSLICISLSGVDEGAVYYWNFYEQNHRKSYDNVYLIAKTFEEFIESLHYQDPLADIGSLSSS